MMLSCAGMSGDSKPHAPTAANAVCSDGPAQSRGLGQPDRQFVSLLQLLRVVTRLQNSDLWPDAAGWEDVEDQVHVAVGPPGFQTVVVLARTRTC